MALEKLILAGSTSVDDFAGFLDPVSVHGPQTLEDIRRAQRFAPNPTARQLFVELEALHQACLPQEWNDTLGNLVECVIERLVSIKYPRVTISREQRMEVVGVTSTRNFPVDVIAWQTTHDHGEAVEVKKALASVVNDRKLTRKLGVLEAFKGQVEAHAGRPSFVGLASLFDERADAELYVQTMLGRIGGTVNLDLLTRDDIHAWRARFYL